MHGWIYGILLDWWRGRLLSRWHRILLCWRNGTRLSWWDAGLGGWGEDKAFADQSIAYLGELGLKKLIFRSREEVGFFVGDGGDQVVDDDRISVEGALFVGVSG